MTEPQFNEVALRASLVGMYGENSAHVQVLDELVALVQQRSALVMEAREMFARGDYDTDPAQDERLKSWCRYVDALTQGAVATGADEAPDDDQQNP